MLKTSCCYSSRIEVCIDTLIKHYGPFRVLIQFDVHECLFEYIQFVELSALFALCVSSEFT